MTLEGVASIEQLYAYYYQNLFQHSKYYFQSTASTPDFSYGNKFSRFFFLVFHQNFFTNQKPRMFLQLLLISAGLLPEYLALVGAFTCGRETRLLIGK
jgi:hypothetical protein